MTLEVTVDGDAEDVDVLAQALSPEHEDGFPGVSTRLEQGTDPALRLVVQGDDVPSVRAAMNAHLSWMRTVEDVLSVDPEPAPDEVP